MAVSSQLNWHDPDIWGIVVGRGVASVEPETSGRLEGWLKDNGYVLHTLNFAGGISPVVSGLGRYFRWQEQFGYSLDAESRNLSALADGFEIELPKLVLKLSNFDRAWSEDSAWCRGFLSIVSEHSLRQLAIGGRFFGLLLVSSAESALIGETFDDLSVPFPFRFRGTAT